MKRVLILLLTVLLLTGCAAGKEPEEKQTEPVAEFTKPVSLYVPDSPIEQQTAGAVKVYKPQEPCVGFAALEGSVVLVTDLSKLMLMDSETGELGAAVKAGESISTRTPDFAFSGEGITYYREEGRELVFLSAALRQKMITEIPEGIAGRPCVDIENQIVYYSKDNQIWAQNMQTGESSLLFGENSQYVEPVAIHLNGSMLACAFTDEYGQESLLYLDAATGAVVEEAQQLLTLQTGSDQYLVSRMDGITQQLVYGIVGGENQLLQLDEPLCELFSMNGGYRYTLEGGVLDLDFYDFTTGTHSAHLRLEGVTELKALSGDGKYIWILADGSDGETLYRWDVTKSATGSSQSYLQPLHTRNNPDVQGLAQCAERAQALTDQYGIHVTVGEAAATATGGYEVVTEYQVPALNGMMDTLEEIMKQFPEGFLQESLSEGSIHISIVREISGGREVVQFYEDSDAHILVAVTENFHRNLLRGLAYVMDSHVLGGSDAYDDWKDLNPEGFEYDLSYYFYKNHENSAYLTEENRAFVDAYAMTFPHEDRSLLFVYAMMDGNSAYFATDTMQEKLALICRGIREAYGYEWYEDPLLWEQYLINE